MFVIMECWYNLSSDPAIAAMSIPERMGRTMRHAGVSVTVTSITDVFAFGIGACTVRYCVGLCRSDLLSSDHARPELLLYDGRHLHLVHLPPADLLDRGLAEPGPGED